MPNNGLVRNVCPFSIIHNTTAQLKIIFAYFPKLCVRMRRSNVCFAAAAGTHHETKRAGVDVGVIYAAVHFVGTVPVRWALVLIAESPRLGRFTVGQTNKNQLLA